MKRESSVLDWDVNNVGMSKSEPSSTVVHPITCHWQTGRDRDTEYLCIVFILHLVLVSDVNEEGEEEIVTELIKQGHKQTNWMYKRREWAEWKESCMKDSHKVRRSNEKKKKEEISHKLNSITL